METSGSKSFYKPIIYTPVLLILAAHTGSAFANANAITIPGTEYGTANNNMTMLDPSGGHVGGTNLIDVDWDGTLNTDVDTAVTNMEIHSHVPFFTKLWLAHDVKVFGPGTYTFETCPAPIVNDIAADGSNCSKSPNKGGSNPITFTVGPDQVGVHMLFDWSADVNIDVVNVWNVNAAWAFGPNDGKTVNLLEGEDSVCISEGTNADPTSPACVAFFATEWLFVSTDAKTPGKPGVAMVDGPFPGFRANFNIQKQVMFNDVLTATENESATTVDVLANDLLSTVQGASTFTITDFDATTQAGGSVTYNGDGTFSYLPPLGYTGPDSFSYTVDDGFDHSLINIGADGQYAGSADVGIDVAAAAAVPPGDTTGDTTGTATTSGTTGATSGSSSGSLFVLPLMFLLLPLRLLSRNRKRKL